jgi:hypothetical protein
MYLSEFIYIHINEHDVFFQTMDDLKGILTFFLKTLSENESVLGVKVFVVKFHTKEVKSVL